jgi:hypothetical protein
MRRSGVTGTSREYASPQMTYAEVSKENENVLGVIQHPQ